MRKRVFLKVSEEQWTVGKERERWGRRKEKNKERKKQETVSNVELRETESRREKERKITNLLTYFIVVKFNQNLRQF